MKKIFIGALILVSSQLFVGKAFSEDKLELEMKKLEAKLKSNEIKFEKKMNNLKKKTGYKKKVRYFSTGQGCGIKIEGKVKNSLIYNKTVINNKSKVYCKSKNTVIGTKIKGNVSNSVIKNITVIKNLKIFNK